MGMLRWLGLPTLLASCAGVPMIDPLLATVPPDSSQVVIVRAAPWRPFQATLAAYERAGSGYRQVFAAVPATVGRAGIVAAEHKREGDGHTPAGVYRFGTAFGYAAALPTALDYRQATAVDHWVDDPASPDYNCWVRGKPAGSAERMRRDDEQYAAGAVIEYNTQPVVAGRGSAIFFHVGAGPEQPTGGCVAAARDDVLAVLAWLDRARRPVIVISQQ